MMMIEMNGRNIHAVTTLHNWDKVKPKMMMAPIIL